ncbi:MAG: hypothetical protein CLLPBCKN_006337 [Chroococcidiopsis cubana SAG 39.79]|uniref:DUF306 domain-containing protein n=1 Tax=Chroococcidiopsis cubana SAG 39.79 TaxID=388085 RepID=A0AB37U828_9CYAN|nr:hypothetical protein [Chroococcidiopsis cubana]MDZ4876902.1 hypothetical protein [Chroococcidiopsis cubana SAG 39.79]PSB60172.1 hypothetical protein C7B79_26750 [Chroococcidiopsis cubana CCALA 043]RUS97071.1 hypothetical protein DSM107010_70150 [Chroococcidiopsis cubana SAG 39.79]
MKLYRVIAIVTLVIMVIMGFNGQSVLADNKRAIPIVGLWEGIDFDDGATHLRSIRRNEDGTFSLAGNATYFMLCGGTDRGLINGTGVFEKEVLKTKLSLTCFNDGQIIEGLESNYELDSKNGTLTELRQFGVRPPIIFHLISPRPKY